MQGVDASAALDAPAGGDCGATTLGACAAHGSFHGEAPAKQREHQELEVQREWEGGLEDERGVGKADGRLRSARQGMREAGLVWRE